MTDYSAFEIWRRSVERVIAAHEALVRAREEGHMPGSLQYETADREYREAALLYRTHMHLVGPG